jgi:hypothetical protein
MGNKHQSSGTLILNRVFDFAHGIVHNSPLHPMDVFPEAASWNSVEILIDYDNSEIIPYN